MIFDKYEDAEVKYWELMCKVAIEDIEIVKKRRNSGGYMPAHNLACWRGLPAPTINLQEKTMKSPRASTIKGSTGTAKGKIVHPISINTNKGDHVAVSKSMPRTGNVAKIYKDGRG